MIQMINLTLLFTYAEKQNYTFFVGDIMKKILNSKIKFPLLQEQWLPNALCLI